MKKKRIAALLLALMMLFAACSNKPKDAVLKVNSDYLTRADLDKNLDMLKKMYFKDKTDEEMNQVDKSGYSLKQQMMSSALEMMALEELLKQDLKKNKLDITDEDLKAEKDKLIERAGGKEELDKQLEASKLNEDNLNLIISKQAIQAKHKTWYLEANAPSEEDLKKFYEENKAEIDTYDVSHILVDTEEAAKEIKKQLDEKADFAELAKAKSTDTGSGQNGGALGEITMKTSFVPEFLEGVKKLEPGQISEPTKSQFGYHLIKLNSIKTGYENFADKVKSMMVEKAYQTYMENLVKDAKMENYIEEEMKPTKAPEQKEGEKPAEGTEQTPATEKPAEGTEQKPETEKPAEGTEQKPAEEKPEDQKDDKKE